MENVYSMSHLLSTGWISHRVSPFISLRGRMECGSAYCVFGVWLELAGRGIFGFCRSELSFWIFFWIQLSYVVCSVCKMQKSLVTI